MNHAFALLTALLLAHLAALPAADTPKSAPSGSGPASTPIQKAHSGRDPESLAALHRSASHRKRRIILNNDGDDCLASNKDASKVVDEFLRQRTSPLAGSQVDTIFYCGGRCFGSVLHRTQVAENLATLSPKWDHDTLLRQLLDQGTDPLQVMLDFCHAKKIEVFWSMRMNDTHDAASPDLRPRLKSTHPDYLLGSETKRLAYGQWTAVDYGHPAVRELAVRLFEEVCAHYDVDGVELDFFRHPVLFKSHAVSGTVGDSERELLTDLVRQIRAVTQAAAKDRGRPILIAIRVPDSMDYCRAIGIDLERWLREGLTDLLIPGGYFRLNPWDYSVRLGHQYGIPVYPSLDFPVMVVDSRVPQREFSLVEKLAWVTTTEDCPLDARRTSLESWRARAAGAFQSGADGVYLFNMFTPTHPLLWQIGEPASLAGKNKLYFVNWRGTRQPPSNFLPKGNTFFHERPLNPLFPLEVKDSPLTVTLPVGDEACGATAGSPSPKVSAELWIQPAESIKSVAVTCNGQLLHSATSASDRLECEVDSALIKKGTNEFMLTRQTGGGTEKVFLKDIALQVTYPGGR